MDTISSQWFPNSQLRRDRYCWKPPVPMHNRWQDAADRVMCHTGAKLPEYECGVPSLQRVCCRIKRSRWHCTAIWSGSRDFNGSRQRRSGRTDQCDGVAIGHCPACFVECPSEPWQRRDPLCRHGKESDRGGWFVVLYARTTLPTDGSTLVRRFQAAIGAELCSVGAGF